MILTVNLAKKAARNTHAATALTTGVCCKFVLQSEESTPFKCQQGIGVWAKCTQVLLVLFCFSRL